MVAMSYQDFLQSTQSAKEKEVPPSTTSTSPSPAPTRAPVIHRKPPANYSTIPFISTSGSVHRHVTQFNSMRSTSISSQTPSGNGSMAPAPQRSFSPVTPVSTAKSTIESPPASAPSPSPATALSFPEPVTNGKNPHSIPLAPPPDAEWDAPLRSCLAIQNDAVKNHNKRPFAALLVGPDKTTTLLFHFSISHVQHAESELARLASKHYSIEYLSKCTLVSTWEPCAMCAGTIYWSGIGRVVYAASEAKLRDLTGPGNSENMTMDLPCRTVFDAGQRKVDVIGPVPSWEEKVVEDSRKWWKNHKSPVIGGPEGTAASANTSVRSVSVRSYNVVTNPTPDEGVMSRIGEDGEYKADLRIDWMS